LRDKRERTGAWISLKKGDDDVILGNILGDAEMCQKITEQYEKMRKMKRKFEKTQSKKQEKRRNFNIKGSWDIEWKCLINIYICINIDVRYDAAKDWKHNKLIKILLCIILREFWLLFLINNYPKAKQ